MQVKGGASHLAGKIQRKNQIISSSSTVLIQERTSFLGVQKGVVSSAANKLQTATSNCWKRDVTMA
jgi:hypothetical protein